MFKVGDYVDYKGEILEIAFIIRNMAFLRVYPRGIYTFSKVQKKKYKKVCLKDCKPLPF